MLRCRPLPAVLVVATLLLPCHRAVAQGTIIDRARKAAQDAANAGTKAATDEVNRQINGAVLDAASADVADGSFVAVFSPWSTDNTKSVQLARYAGNAFMVTTPAGYQVIICDPKGVLPWQTTFTVSNAALSTPTSKPLGTGKGAGTTTAATSGRGSSPSKGATPAAGRASGSPAATAPAGQGNDSGGGKAAPSPSANEKEYKLPAQQITIALPVSGPKAGAPANGSIIVANASQEVLAGSVKIRFAQATIPGEKGPQVVDFGAAFKAMVLPAGTAPTGCLAPGSAKGATTAGRGGATPATPPGGATGTRGVATPPPAVTATTPTTPAITFAEGDVLIPKIDNVKLLAAASDTAKVNTTLKVTDEVVYLGDEQNGYLHVQGSNGEGWARKALLKKK